MSRITVSGHFPRCSPLPSTQYESIKRLWLHAMGVRFFSKGDEAGAA